MYAVVKKMYADGHMPRDTYLKSIIGLAYEHLVLGEIEDARALMSECDMNYVQVALPQQMESDPEFCGIALYVAQRFAATSQKVTDDEMMLVFAKTGKA
jgi:hypothetical protein